MKAVIDWVIGLIIGVIVIIVLAPILFKVAGNVWTQLGLKLGWVKLTPVEKAILCSYYRCTIGCASAEVTGVFGGRGWCADFPDACNLPPGVYEGEEKKVCGYVAEQWPVEVELKNDEDNAISKDKLQALMGLDCLVKIGSPTNILTWSEVIDGLKNLFLPSERDTNTVWIPEYLIGSGKREGQCLKFTDSYSEVKLNELNLNDRKAYIATYINERPLGKDKLTVMLLGPYYYQMKPNEWVSYTQEGLDPYKPDVPQKSERLYRIVELDEEGKKTGEAYVRTKMIFKGFDVEIGRSTGESESKSIRLSFSGGFGGQPLRIQIYPPVPGCELEEKEKSITCIFYSTSEEGKFCQAKYKIIFNLTIAPVYSPSSAPDLVLSKLDVHIQRLQ